MNVLNFLDSLSYAERTWFLVGILVGIFVSFMIAWYVKRQVDKEFEAKKFDFNPKPKTNQDVEITLLEIKNSHLDIDIDCL